MDQEQIERTIQFILDSQARMEAQHGAFVARQQELEARHKESIERMDRFERQLKATRNLVHSGMRIVFDLAHQVDETNQAMHALIDAQQRTEAKLDRLIDHLNRPNGHPGQ